MKANKVYFEGNQSDITQYFSKAKKQNEESQQNSIVSRSFDQGNASENNNIEDDSFGNWENNKKPDLLIINRANSEMPKTNKMMEVDDQLLHHNDQIEIEKYQNNNERQQQEEEDQDEIERQNMFKKYELQKEEPSLISEYVISNLPNCDQITPSSSSSSESIQQISQKQQILNAQNKGDDFTKNKNNIKDRYQKEQSKIQRNQVKEEEEYMELSKSIFSSEMNNLLFQREQELRKPIQLNMIIVGKTGIGKSTFISAFLDQKFQKQTENIRPSTMEIVENRAVRKEEDMTFNINMIDTPGYEETTDLNLWREKIINYITSKVIYDIILNINKKQFDEYKQEDKVKLSDQKQFKQYEVVDKRVHGCLYFLDGPRIRRADLDNLYILQKYVSIIPILAKGDSYTVEEVKEIKAQLKKDAKENQIVWFDVETPSILSKFNSSPFGSVPPFLIISSVKKIKVSENETIYGREYNWGRCDIKNPQHSDFTLLYNLLIGIMSIQLIKIAQVPYIQYLKEQKRKKEQKECEIKEKNKNFQIIGYTGVALAAFGMYVVSKFKSTN